MTFIASSSSSYVRLLSFAGPWDRSDSIGCHGTSVKPPMDTPDNKVLDKLGTL
jgi:hypothetical protein